MPRTTAALALGSSLALALTLVSAPVVAQDPSGPTSTPSPICGVLTADEITQALGEKLPVTASDDTSCSWDATATGGAISLSVSFGTGPLSDYATAFPDATSTEIGGHPALIGEGGTNLFVEVNGGVLSIYAFLFGVDSNVDLPAGLLLLAAAAAERFPSITLPAPPTPMPQPSFLGDAELADLFPDTVGGQPVTVQTLAAADLLSFMDPEDPEDRAQLQVINDALAAQGKTIDDVAIGYAFFTDLSGGISAIRVRGADVRAILDDLLPLIVTGMTDMQQTPAQVAGKDVIVVTDGPDGTKNYAYAKNDVLWIVRAEEPQLSEVLGLLP